MNQTQHQTQNSECGVYCLYYISERLAGRSFEDVVTKIIRDDDMNKFRDKFFIDYKN